MKHRRAARGPGTIVAVVAFLTMASASGVSGVGRGQQRSDKPYPRFEDTWTWFRLAAQHQPGKIDAPLKTLAGWPVARVHRVRHDLILIAKLLEAAANGGGSASMPAVRSGPFRADQLSLGVHDLEPLLGLPPGAIGPRPDPRLVAYSAGDARRAIAVAMAKGVVLQTDLMLAAATDLDLTRAATNTTSSATRIVDGERSSVWSSAIYWDVARVAMDQVIVTPRGGAFAREWYYASSEFQLNRREYDAALPHLSHGRVALKTDARIAFYLGVALENLASPSVQAAIGDNPAIGGIDVKEVLLRRSEDALKTAMALDPNLDEAGLRLARVFQVTGRQDQAAVLLQRVERTLPRAELRYYAALFLGRADEARGRDADARLAFERARALFPDAQSPHLALAALSWRAADAAKATGEIRALPDPARFPDSFDPWWVYDVSPTEGLLGRLASARQAFDAFLK